MTGSPKGGQAPPLIRLRSAAVKPVRRVLQLLLGPPDHDRVNDTMWWVDQLPPASDVRVTVITATHRRPAQLRSAISSVVAQRHTNFEHIVVEDGGPGDAEAIVAAVEDPRMRYAAIPKGGPAQARQRGLELATGEIITYLDDDNTMHPLWLRGVVWALAHHPADDVVAGAMLRETGFDGFPLLILPQWNRRALLRDNLLDMNALAHRAGLPEAQFDPRPELVGFEDWDMIVRLTRTQPPLILPVVACQYHERHESRMMNRVDFSTRYAVAREIINLKERSAG